MPDQFSLGRFHRSLHRHLTIAQLRVLYGACISYAKAHLARLTEKLGLTIISGTSLHESRRHRLDAQQEAIDSNDELPTEENTKRNSRHHRCALNPRYEKRLRT